MDIITHSADPSSKMLIRAANHSQLTIKDGLFFLKKIYAVSVVPVTKAAEYWIQIGLKQQTIKVIPILRESNMKNGIKKVFVDGFRSCFIKLSLFNHR